MSAASCTRRVLASVLFAAAFLLAGTELLAASAQAQTATSTTSSTAPTSTTGSTLIAPPPTTAAPSVGIPRNVSNHQKKGPSTKIIAAVAGGAVVVALFLFWLDWRGRSGG